MRRWMFRQPVQAHGGSSAMGMQLLPSDGRRRAINPPANVPPSAPPDHGDRHVEPQVDPLVDPVANPWRPSHLPTVSTRREWLIRSGHVLGLAGSGAALALGSGCSTWRRTPDLEGQRVDPAALSQVAPFALSSTSDLPPRWHPYVLRRDRGVTRYRLAREGGRRSLHAHADASATGLRCAVDIDPKAQPMLRFSWRVDGLPSQASVAEPESDDSPARVVLAFEGDVARLSLRERLLFDQVELFTGHRLPYATLMYVWDGRLAAGTVTHNHRTSRIRYLTIESGPQRLGRWLSYERNVLADYERVFGESPGRISSVGVLTDGDALKTRLEAWYGDITLASR